MKRILPLALATFILFTTFPLAAQQPRRATTAPTGVTIPAGAEVQVRMVDELSSEKAQAGDSFRATLEEAIVVNGRTIFPKGAEVTGRVAHAKKSGRLTDPGELQLTLVSVRHGSTLAQLSVEPFSLKGESHKKGNVTKIGGGAAAGAVIGAIAGGGKGAAIGAAVGAAAGTGAAAATGRKPAEVESEAVISFGTVSNALTVRADADPSLAQRASTDPQAKPVRSYNEAGTGSARRFSPQEIDAAANGFSARDRRVVRTCFRDHSSGLPPGLAKRESLPPGLERQLRRNGTLPPGLQKRVSPLPGVCERDLPPLPSDLERIILGRRIMLLGPAHRILDLFDLDETP